jgi:hypothetical protein
MNYDTSRTQRRAIALLGIEIDPRVSRESAGEALAAAGAPPSGIPAGLTWQQAAKLSDAALRAALVKS